MNSKKATIYDFARMCKAFRDDWCEGCPLNTDNNKMGVACANLVTMCPDKANEIILNWCKEYPVETRQSKIQKIIPKIILDAGEEYVSICPSSIDADFSDNKLCDNYNDCSVCKKEYWLAEVDENV